MTQKTDRGGQRGRVAMADVAAEAGVSAQTVSRVVNGSARVELLTRARVEAAMASLGYRPHRAARALRTGRSYTIGLVVTTLDSVGNARILEAVVAAANLRGYAVMILTLSGPGEVAEAFDRLRDQGVDGAVIVNEASALAREATLPDDLELVILDSPPDPRFRVVQTAHAAGATAVTEHLLALGHREIRFVAGPERSFAAAERERGWREALDAARLGPGVLVRGDWTSESGYVAGQSLAADPEVTAVFAANDQMALGVLRALAEAGRAVPGALSVVGFDDVADAANFHPPLTTVQQDFHALGEQLVLSLIRGMEQGPAAVNGEGAQDAGRSGNDDTSLPAVVEIPTTLIVRASTAAPLATE